MTSQTLACRPRSPWAAPGPAEVGRCSLLEEMTSHPGKAIRRPRQHTSDAIASSYFENFLDGSQQGL